MAEKKTTRKATKASSPTARKTVRKPAKTADGEAAVLAKIAAMPTPYRAMGERLHAVILRSAPALRPKLFYGMPGYAKDGPVACFFRADKYMTFGSPTRRISPATSMRRTSSWNPRGTSLRWTRRPRPGSPRSCARPRAEGARLPSGPLSISETYSAHRHVARRLDNQRRKP